MNVIILLCDTLRASALSCYGNRKNLSPNIDEIARKGTRFANAFSTINATDPSLTTIFTGKYPTSHGVVHHGNRVTEQEKSFTQNLVFLPEVVRQKDYVTVSLDWLGRWHKRGYDYYCGREDKKAKRPYTYRQKLIEMPLRVCSLSKKRHRRLSSYYGLPSFMRRYVRRICNYSEIDNRNPISSDSAALSDMAIDYIEKFGSTKKLFLFVHYWDNHTPYTAPHSIIRELQKNFDYPKDSIKMVQDELSGAYAAHLVDTAIRAKTAKNTGQILAHYDASVKYVDANIGRIYDFLAQKNLLSDTLVIITADHGESLTENGIYFHHHGLFDPTIRVPLIFSGPSIPEGRVYKQFVQHFDIMPTILDILKMNDVNYNFDGMSLLKMINGEPWNRKYIFAEGAWENKKIIRDTKYKYMLSLDDEKCMYCQKHHSKGNELFTISEELKESDKVICDDSLAAEYKNKLEEYIHSLDAPQEGSQVVFDDEQKISQSLKALGYM